METNFDKPLEQEVANLANSLIKAITVTKEITTGTAIVHFPGNGTANLGLGSADFSGSVPSGGTFVALIPRQATRNSGMDVGYCIVPDNSPTSIRVYGTPSQTYTTTATILYK